MATSQSLRSRLLAREHTTGLFVKMPATRQVELAGLAGFDFVIIDCEHGPADAIELEHHLRAAELAGLPALVRVASPAAEGVLAALDAGATGIVCPHVSDAAAARVLVAATQYPPTGSRGIALSTRSARYGTTPLRQHLDRARSETCVIVQIEDPDSLQAAQEIAAVAGVTAVFIGTLDLSVAAGWHDGDVHDRQLDDAVARVARAAQAAGVGVLAPMTTPGETDRWRQSGVAGVVAVDTALTLAAYHTAASAGHRPLTTVPTQTVVLIPGMLCDQALWSDACALWSDQLATIVARIDLDDSIGEMAASVLSVAPEHAIFVGHSLGAIVALEAARRAPGRVTALALLNASARAAAPDQLEMWAAMESRVRRGEFTDLIERHADEMLGADATRDRGLRQRVVEMARHIGPDGLLRQLAAQRQRPDLRSFLAEVRRPTLVIAGQQDRVCPPDLQEELAAGIPDAELARVQTCGHMSPLEAPQVIAQQLADWVQTLEDRHTSSIELAGLC